MSRGWLAAHPVGAFVALTVAVSYLVVAHASVNAPFFFWEQVSTGPAAAQVTRAWIAAEATFAAAAAIVLVMTTWRWWTTSLTPPAASRCSATVRP